MRVLYAYRTPATGADDGSEAVDSGMGEQLVLTGQVAEVAAADDVDVGRVTVLVCTEETWQDVTDSYLAAA